MLIVFLFVFPGWTIHFQDQDLLSLAENVLAKPSPALFKIKEEITKNINEQSPLKNPVTSENQSLYGLYERKVSNERDPDKLEIGFNRNGKVWMGGPFRGVSSTNIFTGLWRISAGKVLIWTEFDFKEKTDPTFVFRIEKDNLIFEKANPASNYKSFDQKHFSKPIPRSSGSLPVN